MNKYRILLSVLVLVTLVGAPLVSMAATDSVITTVNNPQNFLCEALAQIGMPCVGGSYATAQENASPTQTNNIVGDGTVPRPYVKSNVTLVQVPNQTEIYLIINGRKHLIPTMDIFYDYGFTDSLVQPMSETQLNRYPRIKLLKAKDTKQVYYLTEGGMVRLIPNNKVFKSYHNQPNEVITISKRELNYYPVNEFVFQEDPLNRDIFQLTGNGKRYLTPMAVRRMGVRDIDIAPVSKAELDAYKTLSPVLK